MTAPGDPTGDDQAPDRRRLSWLRRLVWVVLAAGVLAFLVEGANQPPDPYLVPEDTGAEAAPGQLRTQTQDEPAHSGTSSSTAPTTASTTVSPPAAPTTTPAPTTEASSSPTSPPSSAMTGATPAPAPAPTTTALAAPAPRPLAGFDEVAFRITGPGKEVTDGLALLADDGASRSQGLMEQTDLRGYDAMIFRFPSPSAGRFYMRNTRIPLSIAFFDASGRFVSSVDMEPCPDEVEDCPTYGAEGPYVHAIEVAQGDLPRLGIGPGSVLSFP